MDRNSDPQPWHQPQPTDTNPTLTGSKRSSPRAQFLESATRYPIRAPPRETPTGGVVETSQRHSSASQHIVSTARSGDRMGNRMLRGAILKQEQPWRHWSELTIRLSNLPRSITTWDLWQRFHVEGTVVFIEIFENSRRVREGTAKVRFSPPPHRDFWSANYVTMAMPNGGAVFKASIEAEKQKRSFQIQSPIRKQWYPEIMSLYPSELGFGIMLSESTMMNMQNCHAAPRNDLKINIDLLRNRIVINFPLALINPQANVMETTPKRLERANRYMFTIPFGQLQTIYRIELSQTQWALIFSLDGPPQFFRKRLDVKASHTPDALVWSEFDTWFRQTDIVYDPEALKTMVVALKKELPIIDIGNWTTYRFLFEGKDEEKTDFKRMKSALQDYNIEFVDLKNFDTVPGKPAEVWSLIEPPSSPAELLSHSNLLKTHDIGRLNLPFKVRYQLEVCMSQGVVSEHNMSAKFLQTLAALASKDEARARYILEYVAEHEKRIYEPMSIFQNPRALAYTPKAKIPQYCAYSRKVTITPTTLYYSSPTVETTNRVIRKYADAYGDHFLRVQFTDEKFEGRINACANKARNDELFARVYRTLLNGIRIGDRHYEFLAFGNSQFRENGAYFFSPTAHLSCAEIRHWMGDFSDIKVPAKYAARLGLCFSTTRAIHSSGVRIIRIDDIKRNGYCFTDGVGKISEFLSHMIATELNLPPKNAVPSAFQFRMGGCKGILVTWPEAQGQEVHIRKSQSKFKAIYNGLEIIRCSQFSTATLNRQTITILSSLGVPDEVFNRMLSEQLLNYQCAMESNTAALDLLSRYIDDNHTTIIMGRMILDGFMDVKEPFFLSLLHLWRSWSIKLLKEKAKIIVENGAFLLGVIDETGKLRGHKQTTTVPGSGINVEELTQIFVQVPEKNRKGGYVVIEGICLLGRNPSLHPGDIRVVQAVNIPELHHLRDVIVFSQLGDRDLPSMCAGGDLDGDDFFCIWEKDLTPLSEWNVEPTSYDAPKARELDQPVEIQDVMKFFVRHMKNDALPQIAHAHMAQSDFLEDGVKGDRCLELAALHSKAVDCVKTGEPAEMPKFLKPRKWPHFMEKKYRPKEQIYVSKKILGQLYDRVESIDFVPQYEAQFDRRILQAYPLDDAMLKTVRQLKTEYDTAMRRIMAQQEVKSEFEIWTTFVLSKPRVGSDYKVQEDMSIISGALKDRFRQICISEVGGKDFEHLGPLVAAMYRVTFEEMSLALQEYRTKNTIDSEKVSVRKADQRYMPLISFPWLFPEVLGRIATGLEQRDDPEESSEYVISKIEAKNARKTGPDIREQNDDDVVETNKETIRRGEMLDIFMENEGDTCNRSQKLDSTSGNDIDSQKRPVRSPHLSRDSKTKTDLDKIYNPESEDQYDAKNMELVRPWNKALSGDGDGIEEGNYSPATFVHLNTARSQAGRSSVADTAADEKDVSLGISLPTITNYLDSSALIGNLPNSATLPSGTNDGALWTWFKNSSVHDSLDKKSSNGQDYSSDGRLSGVQNTPSTSNNSEADFAEVISIQGNEAVRAEEVEEDFTIDAEEESAMEKLAKLIVR